jgi:hypothetical protein
VGASPPRNWHPYPLYKRTYCSSIKKWLSLYILLFPFTFNTLYEQWALACDGPGPAINADRCPPPCTHVPVNAPTAPPRSDPHTSTSPPITCPIAFLRPPRRWLIPTVASHVGSPPSSKENGTARTGTRQGRSSSSTGDFDIFNKILK